MSSTRNLVVVVSMLSSVVAGERNLRVADGAQSRDPTQKQMFLGPKGDLPPSKSPSTGLHKPTWKPSTKPAEWKPSSKPVEDEVVVHAAEHHEGEKDKASVAKPDRMAEQAGKVPPRSVSDPVKKTILAPPAPSHRALGGSPTKSPSSGLHKPTWKPSSKPAEHSSKSEVKSAASPSKSPSSGLHKPTWKPSSKPNEKHSTQGAALPRRSLAGSPTKSPSSGLHKPTWKPSSKPAEHRELGSSAMKAAKKDIKELKADIKDAKKALPEASKSEAKDLKAEVKADKKTIKADKEVVINEETGRPYGLDEDGDVHPPAKGSKIGQVEGTVVAATDRKDAKTIEAAATATRTDKKAAAAAAGEDAVTDIDAKISESKDLLTPPTKGSKLGQLKKTDTDVAEATEATEATDATVAVDADADAESTSSKKKPSLNDPLRASKDEVTRRMLKTTHIEKEIALIKDDIKASEKALEEMDKEELKAAKKETKVGRNHPLARLTPGTHLPWVGNIIMPPNCLTHLPHPYSKIATNLHPGRDQGGEEGGQGVAQGREEAPEARGLGEEGHRQGQDCRQEGRVGTQARRAGGCAGRREGRHQGAPLRPL